MPDLLERVKTALAGQYEIERELGRGGSATVYLAQDLKHPRQVALKVLDPELARAVGPDRFLKEIETTAALTHPNILPLLDSGQADELLYYVMPFVKGESLRDLLNREKQLPLDNALQIAREVAFGLDYAHSQGVIHRDIKPENVLLSGGHASIADFGIARAVSSRGGDVQTQTGISVGTPTYMSPEQASASGQIDGRSDIYSLGCLLYEMLAGQGLFTSSTTEGLVRQHISTPAPLVSEQRSTVPPEVAHALNRALSKSPADRFHTAGEFANALQVQPTSTAIHSVTPVPPTVRKTNWPAYGIAAVAVVLVIAAIAIFLPRSGNEGSSATSGKKTLVVLPFENLGPTEDEYFADGITEEITSQLATVQGLGVIARTSAIQYKDSEMSIEDIGNELGVDFVLEGTVRWQKPTEGPSRIRVTPQLIRVDDSMHLWADSYDAVMADVFQVQSDVAEKVTDALGIALLASQETTHESPPTSNIEAYDHFLRGNAYLHGDLSKENLASGVDMFRKAVELDPNYVEAWANLSRGYSHQYWFNHDRTEERLEKSLRAAERALELDPNSPAAHEAMGWYHYHGHYDYEPAAREFEIAREAKPNDSDLLLGIGSVRRRQGRFQEAREIYEQGLEISPRDYLVANQLFDTCLLLGEYTDAARYRERTIAIAPDLPGSYNSLAYVHLLQTGDLDTYRREMTEVSSRLGKEKFLPTLGGYAVWLVDEELVEEICRLPITAYESDTLDYLQSKAAAFERLDQPGVAKAYRDTAIIYLDGLLRAQPDDWYLPSALGHAYAALGRREDAIREGKKAIEMHPLSKDAYSGQDPIVELMFIYAKLGEYEAAIDQVEILRPIAPWFIRELQVSPLPILEPLRDNPRFQKLIAETS